MTASPIGLRETRRANAPARLRLGRGVMAIFIALETLLLCTFEFAGTAGAVEPVKGEVKVTTDGGYARLALRFDQEVAATIRITFPVMVVSFKRPIAVDVSRIGTSAPDYISGARLDPDGTAIRIALVHKVKVDSIPAAERLFIDLLPEKWVGVMPGPPREVIENLANRALEAESHLRRQRISDKSRKPETIRVRVATQPTFVRYVFELPDVTNVVPGRADGKFTLNFDQLIKWDLADAKAAMPATLKSIDTDTDDVSTMVTFVLNGTPNVHTFREGRSIAVDVGLDGAEPKPAAQAPAAKDATKQAAAVPAGLPAIEPPETVPVERDAAASDHPPKPTPVPTTAPVKAAENAPPPPPPSPSARSVKEASSNPAVPAAPAAPKVEAASEPPPPARSAKGASPNATAPAAPAAPKVEAASAPKAIAPSAAERKRPAPNPNDAVDAELHQSGDNLRIEFPFAVPTPAAVFRRADVLWLVFDSTAKIDLAALTGDSNGAIRNTVLERGDDGEAIVRIKLARPQLVSLEANGPAWSVIVGDAVMVPSRPLVIARNIVGKKRGSISIPFDHPFKMHRLTDREVGDRLMVVTGLAPARGFLKDLNFVELRVLSSTQGVVLQPLADDIAAELAVDKITISRPSGLSLSVTGIGQQQLATNFRAMTFDTQLWGFDRQGNFNRRQSELIRTAAMASENKRREARLNLARFYLARDMSAEAKAVLTVSLEDERGADDITGTVLKAVADVMLDRPDDALKGLSNPQVGNQLDAPIWRAVAYAQQGKWPQAHATFKTVEAAIGALPLELQRLALRQSLRAAIEVRDFNSADRKINQFESIGVPSEMEATIAVLIGRMDEALGRKDDALKNYRSAAASSDPRAAAQGRLREIVLRFANGDMPRKDVIHELETLTTVWRGDETETEGLKLLAHLYTEDSHYRAAFHVMRTAMLAHPNSNLTRQIQDEAAATFDSLFLAGKGDVMSPIDALGLFYDYRELTPIGRRGDEMIRKLADRLVSVDLLNQAAELLQHQVDHRLEGAARAQVATRLAVIYLMNRKPDRALATLRATRTDGLSNELRDQRLLLESRALSDIGRNELALELVANIPGREATRLRSDILWAGRRWQAAAEQIELLYGERWRDFRPLSADERTDIMRAAIGYALGDDAIGLARFREKYLPKMAKGPDRRAFDVVTAPIGISNSEFQNVAKAIAGVNTLNAFLREMRQRYPDTALVAPGGAAADKAKPAAAPSALPSKVPAGVPLKPDPSPTGSIPRLPKAWATSR
jgi:hypothetical protein